MEGERDYKNKTLEKYAELCAEYVHAPTGFSDIKSTIYNSLIRSYQKGFIEGSKLFEHKRRVFKFKRNQRMKEEYLKELGEIHCIIEKNAELHA